MEGLVHCSANYVALTPLSFLERAANVYGDKVSVIYGGARFSWRNTYERCLKLASALSLHLQVAKGDIVAVLAPNVPALYELHFGVPMAGAVISALNTNADAATLASVVEELEAKLFFVDYQLEKVGLQAIELISRKSCSNTKPPPRLLLIPEQDPSKRIPGNCAPNGLDYEGLIEKGVLEFVPMFPDDELDPISVSFTSGSTGNPKGVVYSHRAAYLNSIAGIFRFEMRQPPVLLWTVDMFRCNGWCLAWTMAAFGGTSVCLRNVSRRLIFDSVLLQGVTHLCGPPALLNLIAEAGDVVESPIPCRVDVIVAGPMPNSNVIAKVKDLGFRIILGYGMTEALGPALVSPWKYRPDAYFSTNGSSVEEAGCLPGLHNVFIQGVDVKDPITMKSTPSDGETTGEVMLRGNTLMSGYLKNPESTREAFRGGWYHTGDLGVRHPDGFIQMKDRAKDAIVARDGTIASTLEVEAVLLSNPKVLNAAVVGKPDDVGFEEVPYAFVELKEGCDATPQEIIDFCSIQLPGHMVPKAVRFGELPVNFSGKVQKFILREKAKSLPLDS